MDELPPRVSALLDEAREGDGPNDGDRTRVHASLMAAIAGGKPPTLGEGGGEAASSAGGGSATATTSAALFKWGGLVLAGVVATAAWVAEPWSDGRAGPSVAETGSDTPEPVESPGVGPATGLGVTGEPESPRPPGLDEAGSVQMAKATQSEPIAQPAPQVGDMPKGTPQQPAAGPASMAKRGGDQRTPDRSRRAAARGPRAPRQAGHGSSLSQGAPGAAATPAEGASGDDPAESVDDAEGETAADAAESATPTPEVAAESSGRQELTLIQGATRSLSAGELNHALKLLREHTRQFPRGVLTQEREGLRVLTLCKLGRLAEGQRARTRFLASEPDSPLAARVRAACASEDGP